MHAFVNKAMRQDSSLKRIFVSEVLKESENRIGYQVINLLLTD